MPLAKAKPTSPGRRFVVSVKTPELHKGKPHAALLDVKHRTGGRNNAGRITTRHNGGGHKQHYRRIDFKRRLSVSNTIRTVPRTSPCCCLQMASVVTFWPPRA